jgi:hypothetical protein
VHCQKIGRSVREVRSEQEERDRSDDRRDRRAGGREGDKQHPRTRRPHERKDGRMRQRG